MLPASEDPLLQIHNRMFRERISIFRRETTGADEREAFRILQQAILERLRDMKAHARSTFEAIQANRYDVLAEKIRQSWQLNCRLDEGTNTPEVDDIIRIIRDRALAWKLLGAGGGGYLFIMAKDSEAAAGIRATLQEYPPNARARVVDFRLSANGFQLTRS